MSNIRATGQFTIIDVTDQRPAQFYLEANNSKIQVYDVKEGTYSPNFSGSTPLIITPRLFFGNDETTLNVANISYKVNGKLANEVSHVKQQGVSLLVQANLGSFNTATLNIEATVQSTEEAKIIDEYSGIALQEVINASLEIIKIDSGGVGPKGDQGPQGESAIFAIVESESGKLSFTDSQIDPVNLKATLYEGGQIINNNISYNWTANPEKISGENSDFSRTSQTIQIKREDITGARSFICTITYNNKTYKDAIVLSDMTDPIYCVIESSNGNIFTNSNINSTLKCRLFKQDTEVDSNGSEYIYFWEKSGEYFGQGKSISINSQNVDKKAVFGCTVQRSKSNEVLAYGELTIVDLLDEATYIYYAQNSSGTNASTTPSTTTKYIGIYTGPALSAGQPTYGSNEYDKIKNQIRWSQYVGADGADGADGASLQVRYCVSKVAPEPPTGSGDTNGWTPKFPEAVSSGYDIYMSQKLSNETEWSNPIVITASQAKNIKIVGEQVFKSTDGGKTYTPQSITLKAECTGVVFGKWSYKNNTGNWQELSGTNTSLTLSSPASSDSYFVNGVATIRAIDSTGKYEDIFSVYGLSDGKDGADGKDGEDAVAGYTVILGNEMQSIATNQILYPLARQSFYCKISAFNGTTPLTPGTKDELEIGKFCVEIVEPDGYPTASISTEDRDTVEFSVQTNKKLNSSGQINLYIHLEGIATITKSISYAASKQGDPGADGADGADGNGIESILEEYAATSSVDSAPADDAWVPTVSETGYGEVNMYLWNRTTYTFTNGQEDKKIRIIGSHGGAAKELQIYSDKGLQFNENIQTITLQAVFLKNGESQSITPTWSYLTQDEAGVAIYQEIAVGGSLTVRTDSVYAFSTIKCECTYEDRLYKDMVQLSKEIISYNAFATIMDKSNIFPATKRDEGFLIQVELYKNNAKETALQSNKIYVEQLDNNFSSGSLSIGAAEGFKENDYIYALLKNNNIILLQCQNATDKTWTIADENQKYTCKNNVNSQGFLAYIPRQSISSSLSLSFEIYTYNNDSLGEIVARADKTLFDQSDCLIGSNIPNNAREGQFWLDTSFSPPVLKVRKMGTWEPVANTIYYEQPIKYSAGDLWILINDYKETATPSNNIPKGTIMRATVSSNSFDRGHWVYVDADAAKQKQDLTQTFDFNSSNGLKIGQLDQQYYIQISSQKLSFHGPDPKNNKAIELASFGNAAADIISPTFRGPAWFNGNATFYGDLTLGRIIDDEKKEECFVWQVDQDGSLSLALKKQS